MAEVQARFNSRTGEYRCGLPDCYSLLGKGEIKIGKIEIKCKCGVVNACIGTGSLNENGISAVKFMNGEAKKINTDIADTDISYKPIPEIQHKPEGRRKKQ